MYYMAYCMMSVDSQGRINVHILDFHISIQFREILDKIPFCDYSDHLIIIVHDRYPADIVLGHKNDQLSWCRIRKYRYKALSHYLSYRYIIDRAPAPLGFCLV